MAWSWWHAARAKPTDSKSAAGATRNFAAAEKEGKERIVDS
jgi:hypothetical protein